MSVERASSVEDALRQLVRETVRDVLREELPMHQRRNGVPAASVDDGFLSVAKAAHLADVAPGTIRAWIRQGRLTAQRAGRVLRVSRRELAQFMAGTPTGARDVEAGRRAAHLFAGGKPLPARSRNT